VRSRSNFHRILRDVEHLVLDELPIHARQLLEDGVLADMADVQEDATIGAAAPLGDLGVVRQRDAIARRELHALGVVALHVALAGGVEQAAALTANGLRDKQTRSLLRGHHAGGMELH
jgi:hypothetical protein